MLSLEENAHGISHKRYFRPTVQKKTTMSWLIEGIFDQSVKMTKGNKITFERLQMVMEIIIQLIFC